MKSEKLGKVNGTVLELVNARPILKDIIEAVIANSGAPVMFIENLETGPISSEKKNEYSLGVAGIIHNDPAIKYPRTNGQLRVPLLERYNIQVSEKGCSIEPNDDPDLEGVILPYPLFGVSSENLITLEQPRLWLPFSPRIMTSLRGPIGAYSGRDEIQSYFSGRGFGEQGAELLMELDSDEEARQMYENIPPEERARILEGLTFF